MWHQLEPQDKMCTIGSRACAVLEHCQGAHAREAQALASTHQVKVPVLGFLRNCHGRTGLPHRKLRRSRLAAASAGTRLLDSSVSAR